MTVQFKNILCPVDFTSASKAALTLASSLARDSHAMLHIVFVQEHAQELGNDVGRYHELWKTLPRATNVEFEHHLLHGHPAEEIKRFADENNVDVIVLGTFGRRGLSRALLGSVAEEVMRDAKVPVLTVRPDTKNLEPILTQNVEDQNEQCD
ncbi:MAG: universal stress protein [Planctomycetales bacterium]|nr:universal stress protein [Planctomycetales bacterium]